MEILPFAERHLGATMDFARRAEPAFGFSWARSEALFRWKYGDPMHALSGQEMPVWIARDGERVVGFLGSQPTGYLREGTPIRGNLAMDLYLEESCRGRGIAAGMLALYEASAELKLMLVSSPHAHSIYLRRGYTSLPGVRSWFFANGAGAASRWILRRLRLAPARQSPPAAESLADGLSGKAGVGILASSEHDEVDAFLERCRLASRLAPLRDVAALVWRYRAHPARHGEIFTLREAGELKAVFALCRRELNGPPAIVIGDLFLAGPGEAAATRRIVDLAREMVDATKACALNAVCTDGLLPDLMSRSALLSRAVPLNCSLRMESRPADGDGLTLSAGDGDYIR